MKYPNVNAHIHTPYSFSAFKYLTDALERANEEDVRVLGINDFYSTDGYTEWKVEAIKRHIYPLFNIEFISLQNAEQAAGIKVNDPNNPGRTYISGKGLKCPPELPEPYASELAMVRAESNHQVKEMCFKLNSLLEEVNAGFTLDYQILLEDHTKGQMRERHLAKFLRMSAYIHLKNEPEAIKAFFQNLFGGKPLQSDVYDYAAVENEIRGKLLKAGGAAFVPEDSKAFLPLEDVRKIIIAAGGIPTYPFLADDANGKFTDFERDVEQAAATLKDKGFYSVEFITTRNSMDVLEKYAEYLYNQGFIVTFGTEHNTPAMEPVKLSVRGGNELSDLLKQINYEGACVIAAHQHLIAEGKDGYIVKTGIPNPDFNRQQLIDMGHEIIKKIID